MLVGAWGVAAMVVINDRQRIERTASAELLGAIPVLKIHARRSFDTAHAILAALDEALQSNEQKLDFGHLTALALKIQGEDDDDPIGIAIIDENEQLVRIEGGGGFTSVSDREYMTAIRGKPPGTLHIGNPVISRISGRAVIIMAMRARPNAFGVNVILTALPVNSFEEAYRDLLISAPSAIGLLRNDGTVLHLTPDTQERTGKVLPNFDLATLSSKYSPMTVFTQDRAEASGGRRKVSYATVEPYPLVVLAAMREEFLIAAWQREIWPKLAGTLMGSIVIAGLTIWLLVLMGRRDAAMARVTEALIELDTANRAKRDFMARMSHELRTPLNAILGFSELISNAMLGPLPKSYQDYGRDINRSGAHLLDMINQVLDITRIEAGSLHPKEEAVDIDKISTEVLAILNPLAESRKVKLRLEVDADARKLLADPMMLRQMLLNLLSNAVKFSPAGEAVTVETVSEENGVLLRVTDHGPGIPKHKLTHLFEPFGSGQSMLAEKAAGIGLGLPIAKKLVEMHGGRLSITTGKQSGTVVTLVFPAERRIAS